MSSGSELINDGFRWLIGVSIRCLGAACGVIHRFRILSFLYIQRRLRRRYGVTAEAPIHPYGPEIEHGIRLAAQRIGQGGMRWAETSGTTGSPKRLLYTKRRLRRTRWTFIDAFSRAYRRYGGRNRSGLYVFRPFEADGSLTSMLVEESRQASYVAMLQAPYRVEAHPAIRALAGRYGATAVRLWVMTMANPGVFYSTNPSSLWLFLHEVAGEWNRSRRFIVDFCRQPQTFDRAIGAIAARLQSAGSAERLEQIARSDVPLPLGVFAPGVHMVMCWTGGYVRPFLDRLEQYLPKDRYRLVPMYSMSTETIETIPHFGNRAQAYLPLGSGVLYEFIEEGVVDSPANLKTPRDLQTGKAYAMVVSDSFGLRRYQTEDVFECVGFAQGLPDLRFLRRRNLEYSFTGEKLSSSQMQSVFERMRMESNAIPAAVHLTCVPSHASLEGVPRYLIGLVGGDCSVGPADDALALQCDRMIQEENLEYRHKRQTGRLGAVRIIRLSIEDFVARFSGGLPSAVDGQFKFLPLCRRLWEE